MTDETSRFINWFRSASSYIRVHRGKTFVIQFDAAAIKSGEFTNLVHDLALLNTLGIRLVLVFGTRTSVENYLAETAISSHTYEDMRITDEEAMEYVKEAAGKLRLEIEGRLSMGLGNTPMSNAEIRVSSGNFVTAKPLGVVDGIDYQFTGEVRKIDVDAIRASLAGGEIVLVAPIGYSITGELFNLNARALAASLAVALAADKLIYLMETAGVMDSEGNPVRQLTVSEAETLVDEIADNQVCQRYLQSAISACKAGVERIHLLARKLDGALLQELFTRDGSGTMLSAESYDKLRQAHIDDISGILELIGPLEQQGVLVERSREKLELEIDLFTVLERDGVIIGCAALYPFAESGAAELVCLAVHPEYHNGGRGEQLLAYLESKALGAGIEKLFALTTKTGHWFLKHGFTQAGLDDLPVSRQALYNYQRNSKILTKLLR